MAGNRHHHGAIQALARAVAALSDADLELVAGEMDRSAKVARLLRSQVRDLAFAVEGQARRTIIKKRTL